MTIADNDLGTLSAFGVFESYGDVKSTSDLGQILVLRDFGREVVDKTRREIAELRSRGELSEAGLKRRAGDLASSALEEIAKAESLVQGRAENVRTMRRALSVRSANDDDAAALAVQLAELRRFLLDRLEPDERFGVLVEAMETGDELTFRAFADAPAPMRPLLIIDETLLRSVVEEWGEKRNPERAAEVAKLERAVAEATRSLATAREVVTGIVGGDLPPGAAIDSDAATRRANQARREAQAEAMEAAARRQRFGDGSAV